MKYFIYTYGCQMNEADSERMAGKLESEGFTQASKVNQANLIIINSCVVRQAAEDSVYGLGQIIGKLKSQNSNLKIILTGCLIGEPSERSQRVGLKEIQRRAPWIDEFWPIGQVDFQVQAKRLFLKSALVPISSGCNNFCTYCVVPYTRGEERSRPFDEILSEVERLVQEGVEEVMLLGQNVNSYGQDLKPQKTFAELLKSIHQIPKIKLIKFMTAHPKDMSDELIEAIAQLPKVERYLHLPVQAGDDEILKRMNRGYTVKDYQKLVQKISKKIPGIKIGTDVIVGFPGETKKQFENTVKLFKEIKFSKAFISMYSPRKGTAAYRLKDDVSKQEKRRRHKILLDLMKGKK